MTASQIEIELPEEVMALYVVPLQTAPGQILEATESAIKAHATAPLKDATLQALKTPVLTAETIPKSKFPNIPLEMLQVMGASQEQLRKVEVAKDYVLIRAHNQCGYPPKHDVAARLTAACLAQELNSVVVDLFVPEILSPTDVLSEMHKDDEHLKFADYFKVLTSTGDDGLWMTTKGLSRAGLPELQTKGIPPQLQRPWSNILTGTAWRLVQILGPQNYKSPHSHCSLPAEIKLSETDVVEALRTEVDFNGSTKIILTKTHSQPDEQQFLDVSTPRENNESQGEALVRACTQVFGSKHDRVVAAPEKSDAMQAAIAKAKAEIPFIRNRILNNQLPKGGQVILKFKVTDGEQSEYLWAFPNEWKNLNTIAATCGNDSQLDPQYKTGKPITLNLDSIADWAVVVDEKIVEGAATNKVLHE